MKSRLLRKFEYKPGWFRYPDGSEWLDLKVSSARAEYAARVARAWCRQEEKCILCGRWLDLTEAVGEHGEPKGMGGSRHDDREENIRAAHPRCNGFKGSRRDVPDYSLEMIP